MLWRKKNLLRSHKVNVCEVLGISQTQRPLKSETFNMAARPQIALKLAITQK